MGSYFIITVFLIMTLLLFIFLNYRVASLVNIHLAQKLERFFRNSPVLNTLCTKDAFLKKRYQ